MLKPLPIGIATFRDVIDGGYLYKDKVYYQKYRLQGKTITQVGAHFDRDKHTVTD